MLATVALSNPVGQNRSTTVYLSPETPRWVPANEDDLQQAIADGLLEETHWLDLKRELTSSKSANREFARDLASFAVDGGTIIVGIEERKTVGDVVLNPQPLAGLPERIESIARTIPDPPLPVITTVIRSDADASRGYVLVHIPRSGVAPHMVDQVYFGRGDKQKIRLDNSSVLRLHRQQRDVDRDVKQLLDAQIARDPIPQPIRRKPHLFVIAEPVAPRAEMLLDAVHGAGWQQRFSELVNAAFVPNPPMGIGLVPDLSDATSPARRVDGAAFTSPQLRPDRTLEPRGDRDPNEDVVEIELTDHGGIRLFLGRLGDKLQDGTPIIFDIAPPLFTRRVVHIARAVGDHTGYLGPWMLGVAATDISGCVAFSLTQNVFTRGDLAPLAQDLRYRMTTTATFAELAQTPGQVTGRLISPLLRALAVGEAYEHLLSNPQ
jgi:hypothetical protein